MKTPVIVTIAIFFILFTLFMTTRKNTKLSVSNTASTCPLGQYQFVSDNGTSVCISGPISTNSPQCIDKIVEKDGVKYSYNTCKVPHIGCENSHLELDGSTICELGYLSQCRPEDVIVQDGKVMCNSRDPRSDCTDEVKDGISYNTCKIPHIGCESSVLNLDGSTTCNGVFLDKCHGSDIVSTYGMYPYGIKANMNKIMCSNSQCHIAQIEKDGIVYTFNTCQVPYHSCPDVTVQPDGSVKDCLLKGYGGKQDLAKCPWQRIKVIDGKVMCDV